MTRQSAVLYGLFALALVFLGYVVYTAVRPERAAEADVSAMEESRPAPRAPDAGASERGPIRDDARTPIRMEAADRTQFLESEIAAKWMDELGYTEEDLVRAQRELRAQGSPETVVNDPGAIMRVLPPRHIASLTIASVDLPAIAEAGKPVPVTVRGRGPVRSFVFRRFDVLVQAPVVRLRVYGHAGDDSAAGQGDEMELTGDLGVLPPGEYRLEIPELGPAGSFPFVVR